jgi:starch-binding outer membrane protein, SusD/RagB family
MKNIKLKLLGICFATATFLSCDDKILDVKPTSFVSDATLWKDINLVDQFVNNIYGTLQSGFTRQDFGQGGGFSWSRGMSIMEAGSDDADGKLDAKVQLFNTADITPSFTPYNEDIWLNNYSAIRKINVLLSKIDAVPGDEKLKARYKAEAQFIRAFCYADLLKTYGGIPLILNVQDIKDDLTVPRNTYDEVLKQILIDADAASAVLPVKFTGKEVGRATKGAAMALKARMLLYYASPLNNSGDVKSRWADAAAAAKAVIDLKAFPLYANYNRLFLDNNNSEVIFSRQFVKPQLVSPISFTMVMPIAGLSDGGWAGFAPTQNLVDSYEMKNGKLISDPTSGYDAQAPYKDRDARLDQTLLYNGSKWKGITVETFKGGNANAKGANPTNYGLKKFLDESLLTSAQTYQGQDNNWIFLRFGEVLLNYAEAQNEAVGPDASVYEALNTLRARAGQPALPEGLSQAEMKKRIVNERRVELVFEEHRFWDVRRWKQGMTYFNAPAYKIDIEKTANGLVYTKNIYEQRIYKEHQNVFPIPQFEMDKNKKLVQNAGY